MANTNREIARKLATQLRDYRKSASITQRELALKSGVGLTPLKRFEMTGGITLNNLIAILRGLGLLSRITDLVPGPSSPSPFELLEASRAHARRLAGTRGGTNP